MDVESKLAERPRIRTNYRVEQFNRRGLRCSHCGATVEEEKPDSGFVRENGKRVLALVEVVDGVNRNLIADCPECLTIGGMVGFSPDFERGLPPDSVQDLGENLMLNEGIAILLALLGDIGTEQAYDNANAECGVGNDNTAASASQTDLQSGTAEWKGMEATFPSIAAQTISWKSSFGSAEGNFDWEEYSVRNDSVADENLTRKVESNGTKSAGTTWTLQIDLTIS